MATVAASGTTSSLSLDTPTDLNSAIDTAGEYVCIVSTANMVDGDITTLLAKKELTAGATALVIWGPVTIAGPGNPGDVLVMSDPIPVATNESLVFVIEQTDGTGRAYDWAIDKLGA